MNEFDYVIVGAGSAGCVLAARLSEEPTHMVAVLEYGGSDRSPLIQMPAALSYPMNSSRYDWGFSTEPEPSLGGRRLACPRGKVLGGSSSINGMVYVRGHALDFDHWAAQGASGWAYADVLPYFQRLENSEAGETPWRGVDGPMHITRGSRTNPLYDAFIEAGAQAGYPVTDDYNGVQQEGFGAMEQTVWQSRRWSGANAYLHPALSRTNLTLKRCLVRRILFTDHRAIGVEIQRGHALEKVYARREVILSASAINSPKLLLLSGIGDGEQLRALGIPVLANRPGVGTNLQDHLELYIQQRCTQPITLYSKLNTFSKALIGARWWLFKTGLGTTNHFESTAFIRSKPGVRYPDIQYHFLPAAIRYDGKAPVRGHGFQAHVGPMRSLSRGWVRLRSNDPVDTPKIQFNYLSCPEDWADFRRCIHLTRELFTQPALAKFSGDEIAPGPHVQNDEALDDFIREAVESAYHPCGTCRMGDPEDPLAVVDPQCQVIGVDGLRVVDSSIFPRITNGNLNGPSLMVAEKAADHLLGRPPLTPINLYPWIHPAWQISQR